MKHTIFALALLAATLAVCSTSSVRVRQDCQSVNDAIAEARNQAARGDFDGAAAQLDEAKDVWHSHERFLGVVLSHSELDDVRMLFAELAQYAALGDQDDFLAGSARLAATIEHIREMELPSYHNLL